MKREENNTRRIVRDTVKLSKIYAREEFDIKRRYWCAGFEQHVYVANVPNEHDGPADNHGPITARRRTHGGKDYVCHTDVQEGEITDGRVRLSESNHHALAR